MSLTAAMQQARNLREELDLPPRDFDLDDLVRGLGVDLKYERLGDDLEGLTLGEQIIVDPAAHPLRQRFTLAHELGHYLLGHGQASCCGANIHGRAVDNHEQEANVFATSLLMPAQAFREDAKKFHARIEEMRELADLYGVSLTATALRFARLTRDDCVVIGSRRDRTFWLSKSRTTGWWIIHPPASGSLLEECLRGATGDVVRDCSATVWLSKYERRSSHQIREEVCSTTPQTWLCLLSEIPDFDDDPDQDENEALEELERRRASFSRY